MINKKTILLTGGNGLLGSKLTDYLITCGYHVIVVDIQELDDSEREDYTHVNFDLTNIANFQLLADKVSEITSNLYGLINNAAYNPKIEGNNTGFGLFEDLDLTEWNNEIQLNLSSPVFLVKTLLPLFNTKDNDYCKIVNVISTYGIVPPNQEIYQALAEKHDTTILKPLAYPVTKSALLMVTKYLSTYPAFKQFNINGLAPGGIENNQDPEFIKSYSKQVPLGRMAKVEEMLDTFGLLLSDGSNYINGQIIAVDGGWTTW